MDTAVCNCARNEIAEKIPKRVEGKTEGKPRENEGKRGKTGENYLISIFKMHFDSNLCVHCVCVFHLSSLYLN